MHDIDMCHAESPSAAFSLANVYWIEICFISPYKFGYWILITLSLGYLTIYIIRLTLNTEFDTSVCVHSMHKWQSQRWQLWCVLLVYGLGKVFTLSFFWLMHFPLSGNQNGKGCFPDVSSSFLHFCIIFGEIKIINLYIFNFINQIGKGGTFHDLL